ncbi:MAG: hypothetical protein MI684_02945, partial [Chlorobiales bacterium]|nr:hypothetical protein [Chlorobiales bacterium]
FMVLQCPWTGQFLSISAFILFCFKRSVSIISLSVFIRARRSSRVYIDTMIPQKPAATVTKSGIICTMALNTDVLAPLNAIIAGTTGL